jgi:hypothetical protein
MFTPDQMSTMSILMKVVLVLFDNPRHVITVSYGGRLVLGPHDRAQGQLFFVDRLRHAVDNTTNDDGGRQEREKREQHVCFYSMQSRLARQHLSRNKVGYGLQ